MSLQTDLEANLTAINNLITAKLAGGVIANWRVGDVSFNEADSVVTLIKFRDSILEQLRMIPSESWATVQNAVGPFGNDATEYVDEDI
jgi:hypothetical protein